MSDFTFEPIKPHQTIFGMLDEATRRTDINKHGEFGMTPNGVIWHHTALAARIDKYVYQLILDEFDAATDGEDPLVVRSIRNRLTK